MLSTKRLSHIDLLESIAILFVVIYHSVFCFYYKTKTTSETNYILYYSTTILSTCVPLFFFANGYLLFNKEFDLNRHIKRIFRIIILYFIWAFMLMPVYMIIEGEPLSASTILFSILNLDIQWDMNFFGLLVR